MSRTTPTPVELRVLVALSSGNLHGLGIRDAIADASGGNVHLGPGTLYETLHRLSKRRWIEAAGRQKDTDGRRDRRKLYRLTPLGHERLELELDRLEELLRWARSREFLTEGGLP